MKNREPRRIYKKWKYSFLLLVCRFAILTIRFFPRYLLLFFFGKLGRLSFYLAKKSQKRCLRNLIRAYHGKLCRKEIIEIGKKVFEHQAMNIIDFVQTFHYNTKEEFHRIWEIKGIEHLENAYKKKKGVLLSTAHIGCWEFSAIAASVLGFKNSGVSAPVKSKKLNDLMVASRERRGMKNIFRGKGKAGPKILEELKNGACTIIMIDQDINVKGCFVDFYGREAFTSTGAAKLAIQSQSPVVTMSCKRLANHKHLIEFRPEIQFASSQDTNKDLVENTRMIHKELEQLIKEDPEQWVWMHRRWRRHRNNVPKEMILQ